jgi:glycosyltransferase involved in cell wall biosynthesis
MKHSVTGRDFVVLSLQDWDAVPTRKHRFARWFAEGDNRVMYVEQQMHWAGWLVDVRRQFDRAWRWLKGPREAAPNLWVFTLPIVLPFFQMSGFVNWINNAFLLRVLRAQIRRLRFRSPILWTYTPHSADFVGRLGEKAAVYECVDDFTASKGLVNGNVVRRLERRLIGSVDLLIATTPELAAIKREGARRVIVAPNGAEVEHFARAADPSLPAASPFADLKHPVVGFLGSLNYWIDTVLLARLAKAHPEWTLALVGPHDLLGNIAPLEGLPNVVMTGRVPYEEVPDYVRAFDVCLNPYILDNVAEGCSPIKLYEYLATGKPIVSVDMPEARRFEGLIRIARDSDDFITQVEAAIAADDGLAQKRITEASHHSWRARFEQVSAALAEVLETKEKP